VLRPEVENRPDLVRIYDFWDLRRCTAVATPKNPNPGHQGGLLPFLGPSGRCRCLLNQLRWGFRLECYKTAPRWVQPRIPLCIHSASSTAPHQANTIAASSVRYTRSSVRTGRCTRHREHPGWAWLGTKQPAWGLRGWGGGAPHGHHAAATLHTIKSVQLRVSCT
jgi:hypothetical protein